MAFGDFFRPKYKHSNENVRLDALESLENDAGVIFKELALHDQSKKVRERAISRINDPKELIHIGHRQDERRLKNLALERAEKLWISEIDHSKNTEPDALNLLGQLTDKKTLGKIAAQARLAGVRKEALARITDEKILGMVVRWAKRGDSWRTAIDKIQDRDVLRSIAVDENRKDVAVAAVDRIEDDSTLESVIQSAKNKGVISRAKKRLKEIQVKSRVAKGTDVSDIQMIHAERVQIIREMKAFGMGNEWQDSQQKVDEHVKRWNEMESVTPVDAGMSSRYSKAHLLYIENRKRYVKVKKTGNNKGVHALGLDGEQDVQREIDDDNFNGTKPDISTKGDCLDADVDKIQKSAGREGGVKDQDSPKDPKRVKETPAREKLTLISKDLEKLAKSSKLKGFERRLKKIVERREKSDRSSSQDEVEIYDQLLKSAKIKLGELREADDWKRWANTTAMEQMVVKARTLRENSADVKNLSQVLKNLQLEWKKIGPAPRAKSEELWRQFKTECDAVYDVVKRQRQARNEEMNHNFEKKSALCVQAEQLVQQEVSEETANKLKNLQSQWKEIGSVPRRKSNLLWKRFKSVCDSYFEKRRPLLEKRQNEMVSALEEKEQIIEKIEALVADDTLDNDILLSEVKDLQRRFRDSGRVSGKHYRDLNERFIVAGDKAFSRRTNRKAEKLAQDLENQKLLRKKIDEIRDLMWDEDAPTIGEEVKSLYAKLWEGENPLALTKNFQEPFSELLVDAIEQFPKQFENSFLDPDKSLRQKQKMLDKLEALCGAVTGQTNEKDDVSIAERLKNAMADNSLGGVLGQKEQLSHYYAEFKMAWAKGAPVHPSERQNTQTRYNTAVAKAEEILDF